VAGILPLIVVFFYRKKIKSILLIYLSSSVIATILLTITIKLNIYNLHIFNTYVAVAIICLFIFYLKTLNGYDELSEELTVYKLLNGEFKEPFNNTPAIISIRFELEKKKVHFFNKIKSFFTK
jgi:hypothetical protein